MTKRERILQILDETGIKYDLIHHPAVFTIEEMEQAGVEPMDLVLKNLFLRDAKGKRHFLVSLPHDKTVDLRALGECLCTRLSFASEQRLEQYLNLTKGSVTPLGILFDEQRAVEVILDREIERMESVIVHPCENTASVVLKTPDLLRIIREHGNPLTFLDMDAL